MAFQITLVSSSPSTTQHIRLSTGVRTMNAKEASPKPFVLTLVLVLVSREVGIGRGYFLLVEEEPFDFRCMIGAPTEPSVRSF